MAIPKSPDPLSDSVVRSGQLLRETRGADQWNRSLNDFIDLLHRFPPSRFTELHAWVREWMGAFRSVLPSLIIIIIIIIIFFIIINPLPRVFLGHHSWFYNQCSLHVSLFSIPSWDLANCRPVHSLMLSSHNFLCLSCLLPPFTVTCKMDIARPDKREKWPYHCSVRRFTMVRKSLCGPIACWTLVRTSLLITRSSVSYTHLTLPTRRTV